MGKGEVITERGERGEGGKGEGGGDGEEREGEATHTTILTYTPIQVYTNKHTFTTIHMCCNTNVYFTTCSVLPTYAASPYDLEPLHRF